MEGQGGGLLAELSGLLPGTLGLRGRLTYAENVGEGLGRKMSRESRAGKSVVSAMYISTKQGQVGDTTFTVSKVM